MSKIFEGLKRGQVEFADVILPSLTDNSALQPEHSKPDARPLPETPVYFSEIPVFECRTLPMRLALAAPLLPFDKSSRISEQYRILRTKLIQLPTQPKVMAISSPGTADGKTVTAVNLAGALALKSDVNVLLVDADFRRSTVHAKLGLPLGPGLSDVLQGNCALEGALIRTEQLDHLYILTAGAIHVNPVELLDSSRWPAVCGRLRELFRYIVVDCPPIAAVADYDLIQAACDGVIFVARPDHTKRQPLLNAIKAVPQDRMLGVIMNCVKDWFLNKNSHYDSYYYGTRVT